MKRRLITALVLAALIVTCVSGCHFGITVHAGPAPHSSAATATAAAADMS